RAGVHKLYFAAFSQTHDIPGIEFELLLAAQSSWARDARAHRLRIAAIDFQRIHSSAKSLIANVAMKNRGGARGVCRSARREAYCFGPQRKHGGTRRPCRRPGDRAGGSDSI